MGPGKFNGKRKSGEEVVILDEVFGFWSLVFVMVMEICSKTKGQRPKTQHRSLLPYIFVRKIINKIATANPHNKNPNANCNKYCFSVIICL